MLTEVVPLSFLLFPTLRDEPVCLQLQVIQVLYAMKCLSKLKALYIRIKYL